MKWLLERLGLAKRPRIQGRVFVHTLGNPDDAAFWELASEKLQARIPAELLPAPLMFKSNAPEGTPKGYALPPAWASGRFITWDPDGFMVEVTDRVVIDRERGLACCPPELREQYRRIK
jgi:hypothetical protein